MRFSVWFKNWIIAFCKLMTFDYRKPKSDSQRRRESERRLKAKYSSANLYKSKRKRKERRSSLEVQNDKLIKGLFGFIGASLGILLVPLGLFDWAIKSAKVRKATRRNGVTGKTATKSKAKTAYSQTKKTPTETAEEKVVAQPRHTTVKTAVTHTTPKTTAHSDRYRIFEHPEPTVTPSIAETTAATADENTPKSTPKNEKDQYIRKRMIIAGSYYCDKSVLDTLVVGAYLDLEAEPDNPYDKDAVKLLFNGRKIGYVAKQDRSAFVMCLKLKRRIYGIITAIIEDDGQAKYEFETWFDGACERDGVD